MGENFAHLQGVNAYEILGVSADATQIEVLAAHRKAIANLHPDHSGGSTRLAQLVNDAREALIERREAYDAWLRDKDGVPPDGPKPKSDATRQGEAKSTSHADSMPQDGYQSCRDPWAEAESRGRARHGQGPSASEWTETAAPPRPDVSWHSAPYSTAPTSWTEYARPPGARVDEYSRALRRTAPYDEPLSSGWLALVAALLFAPLGLWLGIRSCRSRHGVSISAVLAVVLGILGTLLLMGRFLHSPG
jgi:hypothetical protein